MGNLPVAATRQTAPDDIATWLKRKHHGLTVVFTTYQSGEALSKAARSAKYSFDLGIMDEAHKTVGDGDKLFSHLLHDKNLPIRQRIFMTATERRYAGQSDTVLSMDDPAIYGDTFHLLSFKRAMEYDPPILCDYIIISIAVSRDEVAELIRKNVFVKPDKGRWNKEIEANMLASLVALRKAMAKHSIRHAVSFHSSIQRAELFKAHNDAFSQAFPEYGSLETFHVSGKTPTGTRARVIGNFSKTQRALVTNARCLTEGVDVPGIDCVLFADPRKSAVDIVQAVGRALRPAPGKKLGYVIVPILHDADATSADIFDSESFQEILTTLRALAANDDRIRLYRPFQLARAYVHKIGLKGNMEWHLLDMGERHELGRLFNLQAATVFFAFAFEAYLNHIGAEELVFWDEIDQISYMKKLSVLSKHLGFNKDVSKRPLQTILELFKLRNALAHGRTQKVTIKRTSKSPPPPEAVGYLLPLELLTSSIVRQYHDDVHAAIELINAARPVPDKLLLDQGSRSYMVSAGR